MLDLKFPSLKQQQQQKVKNTQQAWILSLYKYVLGILGRGLDNWKG